MLDDAQQRQVLSLAAERVRRRPRRSGRSSGPSCITSGGTARRALAYADSARLAFEEQSRAAPEDAQRHVLLGSRWRIWGGRRRRSGRAGGASSCCRQPGRDQRALRPAPARADLPADRRAGPGAGHAGGDARQTVLRVPGVAAARSGLPAARRASAVRRGGRVPHPGPWPAPLTGPSDLPRRTPAAGERYVVDRQVGRGGGMAGSIRRRISATIGGWRSRSFAPRSPPPSPSIGSSGKFSPQLASSIPTFCRGRPHPGCSSPEWSP